MLPRLETYRENRQPEGRAIPTNWKRAVNLLQSNRLTDTAQTVQQKLDMALFDDILGEDTYTGELDLRQLDSLLSGASFLFGYEYQGKYQDMTFTEFLEQAISPDAWGVFDALWPEYHCIATLEQKVQTIPECKRFERNLRESKESYYGHYGPNMSRLPEILIRNMTSYALWRAVDLANNIQHREKPIRHVAAVALDQRGRELMTAYRGEDPNIALHAEQVLINKLEDHKRQQLRQFMLNFIKENRQFAGAVSVEEHVISIDLLHADLISTLANNVEYQSINRPPFIVATNLTPCKIRSERKRDILPSLDGCSTLVANLGVPIVGYSTHDGGRSGNGAGEMNLINNGVLVFRAEHPTAVASGMAANIHFEDMRDAATNAGTL